MKLNWPSAWKNGLNPRKFAILRLVCDRQTCTRFWHRGGFRRRLPIGRASLEWGEAHTKASKGLTRARFSLSENLQEQRDILEKRHVAWVFAYDSDRVAQNSAAILNEPVPRQPLCRVLDRTPTKAPPFLIFSAQNPTCKVYRVAVER